MSGKNNSTTIGFWVVASWSLLFSAMYTLMNLAEYYNVGIKGNTKGYPFGYEGPVTEYRYYQTAELYTREVLTSGLLSLSIFIVLLFLIIYRKKIELMGVAIIYFCYLGYQIL
ncbi:MAG TPA: hypothetical protein VFG10_14750 [Saprospiraceae bacterium]|nr:hypothetical protein [Saprospiraceae bacterium]